MPAHVLGMALIDVFFPYKGLSPQDRADIEYFRSVKMLPNDLELARRLSNRHINGDGRTRGGGIG